MKKLISLILISAFLFALCSCSSEVKKKTKKAQTPYEAYVSDCKKGFDYASFCGMASSLETSEKAREYFTSNSRKKDGFLITDYLGGICVNKVLEPEKWDYIIPEKIEDKPVVKLGCYLDKENEVKPFIKFNNEGARRISLPDSVKYIDDQNLYSSYNRVYYKVSKSNPYFATDRERNLFFVKNNGYINPAANSRSSGYYDLYYYRSSERKVNKSASPKDEKHDAAYKKLHGYDEYVSDRDKGAVTSFCGLPSSLGTSKNAREYYKNNVREVDGFLVTDYLYGICINRVLEPSKWNGKIPEKIEDKPVIKLGSFPDSNNFAESFAHDDEEEFNNWEVYLPETVKYIDNSNLRSGYFFKLVFSVDKENPYYATGSEYDNYFYAIEDGYVQPVYIDTDQGEM
ncbi:MAG: hypothetical protein IIU14_06750 [Ruminococcus sp.]|nr:hypothetical protein [Ruminococcus sp.]